MLGSQSSVFTVARAGHVSADNGSWPRSGLHPADEAPGSYSHVLVRMCSGKSLTAAACGLVANALVLRCPCACVGCCRCSLELPCSTTNGIKYDKLMTMLIAIPCSVLCVQNGDCVKPSRVFHQDLGCLVCHDGQGQRIALKPAQPLVSSIGGQSVYHRDQGSIVPKPRDGINRGFESNR